MFNEIDRKRRCFSPRWPGPCQCRRTAAAPHLWPTFKLPRRLAFLPDGRMLVAPKRWPVWLVSQQGEKTRWKIRPLSIGRARTCRGVFLSPHYATDERVSHLCRPGWCWRPDCATAPSWKRSATSAKLETSRCCGAGIPKGKGGREGAQVAFLGGRPVSVPHLLATASALAPPRIRTNRTARSCA